MQKPIITSEEVEKFLNDQLDTGVSDIKPLSGGDWSQAYSFISDNKKYVIRIGKSRETYDKDRYISNLNSNIPTPEIYEIGKFGNDFYAISEFSEGEPIEVQDEFGFQKLEQELLKLLSSIRKTDISKTSGYGGWDISGKASFTSWQEYLSSIINVEYEKEEWWTNLKNSNLNKSTFEKIFKEFRSLINYVPNIRELIHADLLNKNLLVKDNKISAVIDWQCSVYGDSLYEIAWFAFNTFWYPQIKSSGFIDKAIEEYRLGSINKENISERMLCYQLHIGLDSIKYNAQNKRWKFVDESMTVTKNLLR